MEAMWEVVNGNIVEAERKRNGRRKKGKKSETEEWRRGMA